MLAWLPSGVALAAVAIFGPSVGAGIGLGAFLLRAIAGYALSDPIVSLLTASVIIAIAASFQALLGAWLMRRTGAFLFSRIDGRTVSLFLVAGAFAGACGAALVTLSFLALGRLAPDQFALAFTLRWCQEALGIIGFTPIIMFWLRAPKGERLRRCAPVAAVVLLALATATVGFLNNERLERQSLAAEIDRVTRELAGRIEYTLDLGANALGGVAGAFETPAERSLEDFTAVAKRFMAFDLGIQAIEWIPRVSSAARSQYEAAMRDQWGRQFAIFERANGATIPAAERAEYFPVGYVYPLSGNEGALGYDLASNAERRAALVGARDSGEPAATGVKLVQNGLTGILLFVPVFDRPRTTGDASFKGFALGVFAGPILLDVAVKGQDPSQLNYWVVDETDPGEPAIMASNTGKPPAPFRRPFQASRNFGFESAGLGGRAEIDCFGRKWVLQVAPTAAFVDRHGGPTKFFILLGGLVLTSLLCGVAIVETHRQLELVADRDKALEDQKFALDQHAIVSIADAEGRIVYANDKFCRTSGYALDQVIGKGHGLVCSDRHPASFYDGLRRTLQSGEVWSGEICHRNASGELYWVQSTIVPLRDREGRISQFVNISTDISTAKRLEHDLRSSEQRLAVALSASSTGLFDFDPVSDNAFYSDTAYLMLGYEPGDLPPTGASFRSLVHPDDLGDYALARDAHFMGKRSLIETELRVRRKDGAWSWIKMVGKAIERGPNGAPTRVIGVIRDVTQTRETRAELAAARDAADRANQAKSEFLATMSHEIRTPMNGVIGMSALLEETSLSTEQKRYVQTIRQSGEALVELIGDILDFTRLEAGRLDIERREFSPVALAENVLDVLEPAATKKGVRIELDILGERVDRALGDPTRLRQALLNLSGNAVKFTPGGRVTIRLIGVSLERLRFEVEDTGIGVPEHMCDRLFQVFSQADASVARKYGGAGLGLAISKRLIEAMGGKIDFESLEGRGSTFWFETPVGRAEEVEAPADKTRRAALICSPARGRKAALDVLAYCGFQIVESADADLIFVEAAEESFAGETLTGTAKPILVFGADRNGLHPVEAFAIGGALTPARIRRAVEGLEQEPPVPLRSSGERRPASAALSILVVEDTVTNQEVLGGLLRRLGHTVEIASDGFEAVRRIEKNDYDLVFMDIRMSGMDGLEATRRIRAMSPDRASVRIIAMTAAAMTSDEQACRDAGMDDFVSKPVNRKKLQAALENCALHLRKA
jgi:PAS domain S-box-containing protein